jgi:monothiol glutaredoxin
MNPIFPIIEQELTENPVVLFMKGSAAEPLCGFSSMVVQILQRLEVPFKDINVLADPELREGIKAYTNWPTIPQLYVKGEFIGGCDITREMYASGELQKLLQDKGILDS